MGGEGCQSLKFLLRPMRVHDAYLVVYNDSTYGAGEICGLVKHLGKWVLCDPHYRDESGMRSNPDAGVAIMATFASEQCVVDHFQNLFTVDENFKW